MEREVIFSEDLETIFGKRKLSEHVIEDEDDDIVVEEKSTNEETKNGENTASDDVSSNE